MPTSGSTSSWIEWTSPQHGTTDVSRVDNFLVKFTKVVASECIVSSNFKLFNDSGEELVDVFAPVSRHNDYDPVAKILELHLTTPLDASSQYVFMIDGLYDAIGDDQDQPHTILFTTNDYDEDLTPVVSDGSVISVVDRTISNADLVPATVAEGQHSAFMNPSGGSYNVAASTSQLSITFSPADVEAADAVVYSRPISSMDTSWDQLAATATLVDDGHMTIDLPLSGSGYVAAGYEYRVVVTIGSETHEFLFAGELSPMFTSVQSVLFQSSRLSSFLVARNIYMDSQYVVSVDSNQSSSPSKAASDYVLYNTLASLSPLDTMKSYSLADLSVSRKTSAQQEWARMADAALAKLQGGPRFLVKGSSNINPHAKRDFGSSGTRIGQ